MIKVKIDFEWQLCFVSMVPPERGDWNTDET